MGMRSYPQVYSIGHSNHSEMRFIRLLQLHSIEAVVDVRSRPFSKHAPHFNYEHLKNLENEYNIAYYYLGQQLGGFPDDPDVYSETGKVIYERVCQKQYFVDAVNALLLLPHSRIVIMCSEEDPNACHRAKLIAAYLLRHHGVDTKHILSDGSLHSESERQKGHTLSLFEEYSYGTSRKSGRRE
ncbi:hypothetical protein CEN46_22975 [Fischerella thermalis CCMEE 5318]|uniref:DUF488 domain-containing protein n=2 Tax=Fischerella TaxID=1190 RepID=A0A2N6L6R7_9CYAN|nr:hypothetical protein CEN46_22975 [Fischerella thermalis CCMEE 5318]